MGTGGVKGRTFENWREIREGAGSSNQFRMWSNTIEACVYQFIIFILPPFLSSKQIRKLKGRKNRGRIVRQNEG